MEKFRAKIQKRVLLLSLSALVTGLVFILLQSGLILEAPLVPEFISGFNLGVFLGFEMILVFFTVRYFISLRNESMLKKLYIEENDERRKVIMEKTGAVGMIIFIILSAIGTVIAGFYDLTVFYTLMGTTVVSSLVRGVCKFYYHNKM